LAPKKRLKPCLATILLPKSTLRLNAIPCLNATVYQDIALSVMRHFFEDALQKKMKNPLKH